MHSNPRFLKEIGDFVFHLTFEDMKLMEVDIKHYAVGMKNYFIYNFEKYEELDKLIDLALETWLKRL